MYTPQIYIYTLLAIQITDRQHRALTHTLTAPTSLVLLPAPAGQRSKKWGYIYICIRRRTLAEGLRQSVQWLPLDPFLPTCCYPGIWSLEAAALLQLLVQTITHTHRGVQDSPVPNSHSTVILYLQTCSYSHTQRWPSEISKPILASSPLYLLTGSSGIIFASNQTHTHSCITDQPPSHTHKE